MTSVLVVDDDAPFRTSLSRVLAARGFDVGVADDVRDAVELLRQRRFDVLLTDLRLGERDGIDLLEQARDVSPDTRPILMSAFATARDHQTAVELGAVRVLCKPFTPEDLLQAIQQAVECETGFRGNVHGLSLVDMLQMFHYARRSVRIEVRGSAAGCIHIQAGEVTHAEATSQTAGRTQGEVGLKELLTASTGSLHTGVLAPHQPRTITRPFQELLIDMLRQIDEEAAASEGAAAAETAPTSSAALAAARAAWHAARAQLGTVPEPAVVLACGLRDDSAAALGSPLDAGAWRESVLDLLAKATAVCGGSETGSAELTHAGLTLGLAWNAPRGFVVALGDPHDDAHGPHWFRSQLSALARSVGRTDE